MSPRATRVSDGARIVRFDYGPFDERTPQPAVTSTSRLAAAQIVPGILDPAPVPDAGAARPQGPAVDRAAEREAFAAGYAQGERAGAEVATRQVAALRERLTHTLDQLSTLQSELTYRTERQVVELAVAIAGRILHREVSLDRELLLAMARIALDRMGDATAATIRLHPDDEAAARGAREHWPGGSVAIVADPAIRPGGCLVQTQIGQLEIGVDSQLKELSTAILGDVPVASTGSVR